MFEISNGSCRNQEDNLLPATINEPRKNLPSVTVNSPTGDRTVRCKSIIPYIGGIVVVSATCFLGLGAYIGAVSHRDDEAETMQAGAGKGVGYGAAAFCGLSFGLGLVYKVYSTCVKPWLNTQNSNQNEISLANLNGNNDSVRTTSNSGSLESIICINKNNIEQFVADADRDTAKKPTSYVRV